MRVRSALPGAAWPAMPGPLAAQLVALVWQLERTQWLAPDALEAEAAAQRHALLDRVLRVVPWYQDRYAAAGLPIGDPAALVRRWLELPILRRADVAAQPQALGNPYVPEAHGPVATVRSSGSTGTPIAVQTTRLSRFCHAAVGLREHLWHRRDATGTLAAIRPGDEARRADGRRLPGWGPPVSEVLETGPALLAPTEWPVDRQLDWLAEHQPDYLIAPPSVVRELARRAAERSVPLPRLREVRTFGEVVDAGLRALVADTWQATLTDMYSSQEAGYIALQCPEHDHYHAQMETVWVEVLDDGGQPCPPGRVGEVVLTVLHNFATPLIRYAPGDYAEVGPPCPCGRGLPVLRRILGRRRNLATAPDGSRFWPSFPSSVWATVAPIRQLQMVQRTPTAIEVHYVLDRELATDEREALGEGLRRSLGGHRYVFSWHRRDAPIRRGASGKYEDFVNAIDPP